MITRLDQLTMARFIDLLCGDLSVLEAPVGMSATEKALTMRNIIIEYKDITDSAGLKSFISTLDEKLKNRMAELMFKICLNLLSLQEYDRVREVLQEYGINAMSMNDTRLKAEVEVGLERVLYALKQFEDESQSGEHPDIRREFDDQIAAMMSYFKFQIDVSTMKASLFAHLVARMHREIKAQKASSRR